MTTQLEIETLSDAELVSQSIRGDRQAFRQIVERYQSLICGLTFAACGDVHLSEDLAQETFLQAWTHLAELKDASRLRSWLCGIARNLIATDRRKRSRTPIVESELADQTPSIDAASPPNQAIAREEQAIIWGALQRLSVDYREPLVLYYRQQESVAQMAAALEISEETARQRLVRGRAMLARHLEGLVDRGLRISAPTRAFTLSVVAALPAATLSAKASGIGGAMKASASIKAATAAGVWGSVLLGPTVGMLGAYAGYRTGLSSAIAPQERTLMRRFAWKIALLVLAFNAMFVPYLFWNRHLRLAPILTTSILIAATLAYVLAVCVLVTRFNISFRKMRAKLIASDAKLAEDARAKAAKFSYEYRSATSLFGLPLVHVNVGRRPDARPRNATGWFAIGGKAYAPLFACGGIAVAPISIGGFAVGIFAFGGLGIGILGVGGLAIGGWSVGGLAIGLNAIGGASLAWQAAEGGIAIAHTVAQGGVALAAHANDAFARKACNANSFFRSCGSLLPYANWLWVLFVLQAFPLMLTKIAKRGRTAR
jgi:RNA polymerase sigma factor (sigma-70 family)